MQAFLLFDRTEQIDTIFASLLSLNVRVRQNWVVAATLYYMPRIAGFWLWLVATISLGFIWLSIETVKSGQAFCQQFDAGYGAADIYAASEATIEEMETAAYLQPTIEQCAAIEATIEQVFEQADSNPLAIDLGEWWKSTKGKQYRRAVDLKNSYNRAKERAINAPSLA